jgi:hypothetical protein
LVLSALRGRRNACHEHSSSTAIALCGRNRVGRLVDACAAVDVGPEGLIVFIQAGFRGQLRQFVTAVTAILAVLAGLVLVWEFRWTVAALAILAAGVLVMWQNLSELRR